MTIRLRAVALPLAVFLALVPAAAAHALKARASQGVFPAVKSIKPTQLGIGDTLTITGSGFVAGEGTNTVIFKRDRKRPVFVKAGKATDSQITVVIPDKLLPFLATSAGKPIPTRFRLRIVSKRFGLRYTDTRRSPRIGPAGSGPTGPGAVDNTDCDKDGIKNDAEADDDNDFIPDTREKEIKTDPCLIDTDADGIEDGFEYESALDLNSRAVPYPGKRPYPNALDPTDANIDHDGDGLTLAEEQAIWRYGGRAVPLSYSDGDQTTNPIPAPADPALAYMDIATRGHPKDGILDDGEKDADGDKLGNWDELHGRMTSVWWDKTFEKSPKESRYPLNFLELDFLDPDTDGDGVIDGDDDQDHDGYTNSFEIQRPADWQTTYVSEGHPGGTNPNARVQPFNPCKPVHGSMCHRFPPFGYYPDDEDW